MAPKTPILVRPGVSPHDSSSLASVPHILAFRSTSATDVTISDKRPEDKKLHHYSSQLREHLQWGPAFKMQIQVFRNSIACVFVAVLANGCFYTGNIFSLKSSTEQSPKEFLMAILVWTTLLYDAIMVVAYLPSLMSQRFLKYPDYKPSLCFCAQKLMKRSSPYLFASMGGITCLGLLVQNTALIHELFLYRLHFYLADLCNLTLTAGFTLAVRKIYYEETYQGSDCRLALRSVSKPRAALRVSPQVASYPVLPTYHVPNLWHAYLVNLPYAILVALAGGYVHIVSSYSILNRSTFVIMVFTILGIAIKLALQEAVRAYIIKTGIRSIRTMCVLVGVPTVLIDTQARIVLLGAQTNSFLISGTFGMAVAEICLRAAKAAFVSWTIRRRAKFLEEKSQQTSDGSVGSEAKRPSLLASNLKFELWRRQVISYHTAEITADTYAEYIAIGCSQSLIYWFVGHPYYPALQISTGNRGGDPISQLNTARWRRNQILMLAFQFVVEIFVDYVCVVMEIAAGFNFDRIKDLSTFLGVLFMAMAVINISISSAVYLCVP
ncbi:unnamed protein product [Phytophthora fragariaefolia]|uniref:Unnamed protein product n=1 Tax=Phytophthora fragariaefolia TaxID=1490495 RepID=A0A9W6YQE7_9STRA|nr:unnamed protein product [Phytophthora fragariaefolia]